MCSVDMAAHVCDKLVSIRGSALGLVIQQTLPFPFLTPPTKKGLGTKLVAYIKQSSCSRTDHSAVAWIAIMLTSKSPLAL